MRTPLPRSRLHTTTTRRRVPSFALLRVAAFTATAGVACGVVGLVGAGCDDGQKEAPLLLDATPPPAPGACVVRRSTTTYCDAAAPLDGGGDTSDASPTEGLDGSADAGSDDAASDAAIFDGAGIALAPPESENRCLLTEDVTIACPSNLAEIRLVEGKAGATDVVLSQVGLAHIASPTNASLVPDDQAHLQHLRIGATGEATAVLDPVAPFAAADTLPAGAYGLLPASEMHDAQLLFFAKQSDATLTLQSGALGTTPVTLGAPFTVAASMSTRPRTFTSRSGEGFVVARPRAGQPPYSATGPLVLVRGLPDAPRALPTSVGTDFYVARADPSGTPVLLYHDGTKLHLREGEDFASERWSTEVPLSASGALLDVGWLDRDGTTVPVVLYRDGNDVGVRFADTVPYSALTALGQSFSTCPRRNYVGVTCDACPVGQYCEVGSDAISDARLFSRGGRLFAVFMATDTRQKLGYARSVIPIINVGCACTLEDRGRSVFADSLVVVEVMSQPNIPSPMIVERMRIPLYKANTATYVALSPRSDGDVDVVVGGALHRYEEALGKLPEKPVEYRLLHLSTGLVP